MVSYGMNEMGVYVVGEIVDRNLLFLSSVVIIKAKVHLPRAYSTLSDFSSPVKALWISCSPSTWWRLWQKRVMHTIKVDTCKYITFISRLIYYVSNAVVR